ncbi:MAG: ParB/RepB/Spo0J family partition protein [Synergistota bacterium]|nr:ParB/RepB/Spo0J family partition protein [Synergistota bacterium]
MRKRPVLRWLPIDEIEMPPNVFRPVCDRRDLDRLALSIAKEGLLQPLLVQEHGDRRILVDGCRRLLAAKIAGITEAPVWIIGTDTPTEAVRLAANSSRTAVSTAEKVHLMASLRERTGLADEEAAEVSGCSMDETKRLLGFLSLTECVLELMEQGLLDEERAEILALLEPESQKQWAFRAVREKLTARKLKGMLRGGAGEHRKNGKPKKTKPAEGTFLEDVARLVRRRKSEGEPAQMKVRQTGGDMILEVRLKDRRDEEGTDAG